MLELIVVATAQQEWIGDTPSGATFSPCRTWRYTLWRRWEPNCQLSNMVAFCGLNPSTADESVNDPTVTRCINFAKAWGYGGMVMLNAFAFRATEPKVMKAHGQPVGAENDQAIRFVARRVGSVVCAWGMHGAHQARGSFVLMLLRTESDDVYHLGLNKDGTPKHPLYLSGNTERVRL